ncbi:hypothetical protein P9112_008095 [Eukaryota sp. TZLM1-RC]
MGSSTTLSALVASAETLVKKGHFSEALTSLNQAIALKPDDLSLQLKRARCSINVGDTSAAINDALSVLKTKNVTNIIKADGLLVLGDAYYASGDLERACVTYHRGLRIRPLPALSEGVTRSELAILNAVDFQAPKPPFTPAPSYFRSPSLPPDLRSCRVIADSMPSTGLPERGITPVFSSSPPTVPPLKFSPSSKASTTSAPPPPMSSLSTDRKYLSDLLKDTSLQSSPKTPRERRQERLKSSSKLVEDDVIDDKEKETMKPKSVMDIIDNGMQFIDKRESFWKERTCVTPRKPRSLLNSSVKSERLKLSSPRVSSPLVTPRPIKSLKVNDSPRFSPRLTPRMTSSPRHRSKSASSSTQNPRDSQLQHQRYILESLSNVRGALESGAPKLALNIANKLLVKLGKSKSLIDSDQSILIEAKTRDLIGVSYLLLDRARDAALQFDKSINLIEKFQSNHEIDTVNLYRDIIRIYRHQSNALSLLGRYYDAAESLKKVYSLIIQSEDLVSKEEDIDSINLRKIKCLIDQSRQVVLFCQHATDEEFENSGCVENTIISLEKCLSLMSVKIPRDFDRNFVISVDDSLKDYCFECLYLLARTRNYSKDLDYSFYLYNILIQNCLNYSDNFDEHPVEEVAESLRSVSFLDQSIMIELVASFGSLSLSLGKFKLSRYLHDLSILLGPN